MIVFVWVPSWVSVSFLLYEHEYECTEDDVFEHFMLLNRLLWLAYQSRDRIRSQPKSQPKSRLSLIIELVVNRKGVK